MRGLDGSAGGLSPAVFVVVCAGMGTDLMVKVHCGPGRASPLAEGKGGCQEAGYRRWHRWHRWRHQRPKSALVVPGHATMLHDTSGAPREESGGIVR